MTEILERWRWAVVVLLAVPMLVAVVALLEEELDGVLPRLRTAHLPARGWARRELDNKCPASYRNGH